MVYHILNRGNDRKPIFHKRGDARAFLRLLAEAKQQVPMRLLAYCLMTNHWHLVLWPHEGGDGDVSGFMAWLSNAHVRRYRQHYHTITWAECRREKPRC
jgi:putative transposase